MNRTILSYSIPDSVRALDAFFNQRVVEASGQDIDRLMLWKTDVKRRLASLPDALVDTTAAAILRGLQRRTDGDAEGVTRGNP